MKPPDVDEFRSSQGLEVASQTPLERPTNKPRTSEPNQIRARASNSLKPKEFIESINMIKDLLQSNIVLRENV